MPLLLSQRSRNGRPTRTPQFESAAEEAVALAFASVLKLPAVGRLDNFLNLGGGGPGAEWVSHPSGYSIFCHQRFLITALSF